MFCCISNIRSFVIMQLQADVNLQEFIDSVLLETTSFEENRKVRRIAVHTHTHTWYNIRALVTWPNGSLETNTADLLLYLNTMEADNNTEDPLLYLNAWNQVWYSAHSIIWTLDYYIWTTRSWSRLNHFCFIQTYPESYLKFFAQKQICNTNSSSFPHIL